MTNLFVTQKQAVDLKELGFTETCFAGYEIIENGELFIGNIDGREQFNREFYIPAPTKQQVFKWFRDNHHLFANIYEWVTGGFKDNIIPKDWKPECRWKIYKPVGITYSQKDKVVIHVSDNLYRHFYYYEEAESACIDNLIEIIKTK